MAVAGVMLAHQTASKAVREALFLSGPGILKLPLMVIATSVAVVVAVPVYAQLLARFGPRVVVPTGFLLSAAGHVVEWRLPGSSTWLAIVVYLHVAGFGALLLSGFWSLVSELFDPRAAKARYGPIAAAGTTGGLAGGLAVLAAPVEASLIVLAGLHAACAAGVWWLGLRAPASSLTDTAGPPPRLFEWDTLRRTPHLRTLALLVVFSAASAGIVDYLFKERVVADWSDTRTLQQFFALFYMAVGVLTFIAQTRVGPVIQRLGIGRTVSALPVGLGTSSLLTLVLQVFPLVVFPLFAMTRGVEAVLRGSWFRSGYELLFVPMAPDEKRRTKTFLDVTCDRAGEALGALVVLLVARIAFPAHQDVQASGMLAIVIATAAGSVWLGRRIDVLYHGVVAGRLAGQASVPVAIQSETGWTILDLPAALRVVRPPTPESTETAVPAHDLDPRVRTLVDLRSGDRVRVEAALHSLVRPDRVEVAQVLQLLAWDDLAPLVRLTLEKVAASHVGLLEDALRDRETDFAIRRRIPRILSILASERALRALLAGLDDGRFEVRYQCAKAITRMQATNRSLTVDLPSIVAIVERELSVPLQVRQSHRLLDADPEDESEWPDARPGGTPRHLEYLFSLLAIVLPREPLRAAFQGLRSGDPELRALTLEYLEGVLPPAVVVQLWAMPDVGGVTASSGDAP
jgi:hypothetical protein